MKIGRVGVVGCGLMGSGIVQVCAQSGYQTVVSEVSEPLMIKGMDAIKSSFAKAVKNGKMADCERDETLGRVKGAKRLGDLKECDLIIEAIVEDLEVKHRLFSELDALCQPSTILATNTSSLPIIEIAAVTHRPDRVVGIHFFNPAPVMPLVEIVRSIDTSDGIIETARGFCQSLSKTVVVARDTPGFIVNRLLIPYLLDAVRVYESGVATIEEIDNGMKLGCDHPMGAFALLDLIGLDTICHIADSMYGEFKEARFAPSTLLKRMVTAGQLGRKTGKGFYDYS